MVTYFRGQPVPLDFSGLLALIAAAGGGPAAARRRLLQDGAIGISSLDFDGGALWVVLSTGCAPAGAWAERGG